MKRGSVRLSLPLSWGEAERTLSGDGDVVVVTVRRGEEVVVASPVASSP